jgi:uncharacterized protein
LDRVFLDANVLFSAAYLEDSPLLALWSLDNTELVTSLHALEETDRNLSAYGYDRVARLNDLVSKMTVVAGTRSGQLPEGVDLPDKDVPILLAAIDSGCSHLLTGDKRHFGTLNGKRIGGVLVQPPSQYLRGRNG